MGLSDRCSQQFNDRDWIRGKDYFARGRVTIAELTDSTLLADVRGSRAKPYEVSLDWSRAGSGVVGVSCTCRRFLDGIDCKHIAATMLAADAEGVTELLPGRGPLEVESIYDEDDDVRRFAENFESGFVEGNLVEDEEQGRNGRRTVGTQSGARTRRKKKRSSGKDRRAAKKLPAVPPWKKSLSALSTMQHALFQDQLGAVVEARKKPRQFWYALEIDAVDQRGLPRVDLYQRIVKKDGTPGKLTAARITRQEIDEIESDEERETLELLLGNAERSAYAGYYGGGYGDSDEITGAVIERALFDVLLPRLCASGRFGLLDQDSPTGDLQIRPLAWESGAPWRFQLSVRRSEDRRRWHVDGKLVSGERSESLAAARSLVARGLVAFPDRIARIEIEDELPWLILLRASGGLQIPVAEQDELIERLAPLRSIAASELPEELRWEEQRPPLQPRLIVTSPGKNSWRKDLECDVEFRYGDWHVPLESQLAFHFDRATRRMIRRDLKAEKAALARMLRAGVTRDRYANSYDSAQYQLTAKNLPKVVGQLSAEGWLVEAQGQIIRRAGELTINVTSAIDWFDLEGTCDFGGVSASLPALLAALRRGEAYVELDDGSRGMLPDEWLKRYAPLAELGRAEGDRLRFVSSQAALLDALLAAQESHRVSVDEPFAKLRARLHAFQGVQPRQEPPSFVGELRNYQREGLGWLHFLDEFGFGGCLADDMGLGKTVQVLARLEERRAQQAAVAGSPDAPARLPSLVVVPRSLVFNWIEESRRFAPQLRVLNYTGLERREAVDRLSDQDLVITTYGTLRRDIARLGKVDFDYAILDEAQAIKNAASQAAKACRLLRARRRLAMTGTPVENHLGELWSLVEFINPGMLGRSNKLAQLFSARANGRAKGQTSDTDVDERRAGAVSLLGRALRPFLLRRTKQQVLTELPSKTEQTLFCELDAAERKQYDELRDHYRQSLLARIDKEGVNKSKIHVLEALLRLRQAACHPGLLDKKKVDADSSKLETLLEQLGEVLDEGHKALVFSQFTSLLAIVRRKLDKQGVVHEYLDGRTVKRQQKVERFQTDPDCQLFLISLKAGGQGLNLTAAEYVFILDPWWNPAVEAQAVDRAHRIGQERQVFAYRLIARGTVEEKILQLQEKKRSLAEAIVSADNSLLRSLTAEDLQLLLS